MGNCLIRNNQISAAQDDDGNYDGRPGEEAIVEPKAGPAAMPEESMKKTKKTKKKVRLDLQNDEGRSKESFSDSCRSGSVRIRLVMTQEELKRILSYDNDHSRQASLQQLLSSVKKVKVGEDDGDVNAWRPTLDSIPEDRSTK